MYVCVTIITKEKPTAKVIKEYLAPYKYGVRVERYIKQTREEFIQKKRENLEFQKEEYKKYLKFPLFYRIKEGKDRYNYFLKENPDYYATIIYCNC